MHEVADHADHHAVHVRDAILESRAADAHPGIALLQGLELERLLGCEMVLANQVFDRADEILILEHQQLRVEDAGLVGAGALRGALLELAHMALHVAHGGPQPPDLLPHLRPRHHPVRHVRQRGCHDQRRSDRDPGRDSDAAQQPFAHERTSVPGSSSTSSRSASEPVRCISLNPAATRASNASIATSASSPSARMFMDEPRSAESIITPMMLLPLTLSPSLLTWIALLNRLAVFTNSAAGRACSPSGFTMRASRSISATATPPPSPALPRRDRSTAI